MIKRILLLLLAAVCLLSGCALPTVELYCLPKRPQSYSDLQEVFDSAMVGLEYSAPRAGQNQQTVQMADLDGDGIREYLLFAKTEGDKPLRILIFAQQDGDYALVDTIACNGTAFDRVDYAEMDGDTGLELIIGCRLGGQLPRSASVYSFADEKSRLLLSSHYTDLYTCDLDGNQLLEMLVIRAGDTDTEDAVLELYSLASGNPHRYNEERLSVPVDQIKCVTLGSLTGGQNAVFVCSGTEEIESLTDVYALRGSKLVNVARENPSVQRVSTVHGYYVYAQDIDKNGEVELPALLPMRDVSGVSGKTEPNLIRWSTIDDHGQMTPKLYTYHDFLSGWYLELEGQWIGSLSVTRHANNFDFYLWDTETNTAQKVFSIHVLSGQDREAQALVDNRFVLYKGESVIYAARLEVASGALEITQEQLIAYFHLIRQDWKSGEK